METKSKLTEHRFLVCTYTHPDCKRTAWYRRPCALVLEQARRCQDADAGGRRRARLRQGLQAAGLRGVHDDGARGLVPAAAQRLIHHHLADRAVHLRAAAAHPAHYRLQCAASPQGHPQP